ncbi:hypothetical protein BLNAU_22044 [Blattamonas nauphoetae]|uniref:Protein kinase domain-containing protein n=1 Tax=Blattamonas nauphoetae TaxID=2049346 RepID=A0ABQ9WUL9_9EUKA|nr:hypothetical protein BLNAU_22044 [Blattamonas nauphoetae]
MECSPLIVCGDNAGQGSHIQIIRSTHISNSNVVLPLVGTCRNPSGIDIGTEAMKDKTTNSDSLDRVSISCVGLLMTNQHFALGTGPLFTFHTADALTRGMSVKTSLLGSTLVNVSSSSAFSPSEHHFGSEVNQRVVGSCVSCCTNHDSGTGMMSPNMGGNLVCLNTSFSSCVREQNGEQHFSYESRTQTSDPARFIVSTADVTSVSFTLCTFSEMTVTTDKYGGGSAIALYYRASSALTITTCCFDRCTVAFDGVGGGAVFFNCKSANQPFSLHNSSFTGCHTFYDGDMANVGGSVYAYDPSSATIDRCFFENSKAPWDGAIYFWAGDVAQSISNSAFVGCSSKKRGGAFSLFIRPALFLSFLQFRDCSSDTDPDGRDIYFFVSDIVVDFDMIQFCDSTSGSPNVWLAGEDKGNSKLVPQIKSTPTIVDVDVSFSGSEATVTVETDIAIKGTLGVLLNGSNVPRLVHVVFGEPTVVSKVGTAVVSCGSNGILPIDTTYIEHKWALIPFPRPTFHSAVSTLKDWNTTEIVLSGVRIYEGKYWIIVEKDGKEWNITLTRTGSETDPLTGTAPLHPSTAPGRLEWSTEYEVAKVMWQLPDGVTEEEAVLTKTITFTTPDAPIRITAASCSLGGVEQKSAHVTLTGVKLGGDKDFNITVRKMDGSSPSGSPVVLSGKLSASPLLSFETRYLITEFAVKDSVSYLDADVTFYVPPEPARIEGVAWKLNGLNNVLIVELSGRLLSSAGQTVVLSGSSREVSSNGVIFDVTSTTCFVNFSIGSSEDNTHVVFGGRYTLLSVGSGSSSFVVTNGLFIDVPHPPTITSITCPSAVTTPSFVLTVSGSDLPSGKTFTVTLTSGHTFEISFSSETAGTSGDIAIGGAGEVQSGTGYSIKSIIRKVSGQEGELILFPSTPLTTPLGPTLSLISCDFDLSNPNFVKVTLTTMNMSSEAFTLTLTTTAAPIEIVELSLSAASISSGLIVVEVYNKTQTLKYGRSYSVSGMRSSSVIAVVSAPTFSIPAQPPRIVASSSRTLNGDRTQMEINLVGRALSSRTGTVGLTDGTKTWESLSNVGVVDNTHCTAEFGVGEAETVGLMKYGSSYTLKGSWTKTDGFIVNDGITVIVPLPLKITNMTFSFSNTLHTGCFVTLTGTGLIVGNSLNVTLNNSLSFIATITSDTEAKSAEVQIGWPSTIQHNTNYEITSIEAMNEDDGETFVDPAISGSTGSPVRPLVFFVDSGSSHDSSLFCGDSDRPCSSIEVGWRIVEGVGVDQVSVKIIESTTLSTSISILSNKRVVITKGTDFSPTLRIPSSSSSMSGGEGEEDVVLIELEDSFLEMESLNVVVEWSDLSLSLIAASRSTVVLLSVSIAGPKERRLWNSIELDGGLCDWESGFLKLVNSTTTITSTQLSHLWQGAINMDGGDLTIRSSSFDSNNPHSSSFPSLRHNIHCSEGGEIEVGSLSGGDGLDTLSAWISPNYCSLTAKEEISRSPFFVPTLSSSSTSKLNKTEKAFSLTIVGSTLIPCSLMLEVFEKHKDGKEGQMVQIPLSEDSTESFNETHIEMSLPLSTMPTFDKNLDWCGRLVYGENDTTTSFVIQKNSVDRAAQAAKDNMKWWIPLVVSLVCLLVIIVIVVIICWRRRKQNNDKTEKGTAMKELDEEDAARMELEVKMDETIPENSFDHLIKTQQTLNSHVNLPNATSFFAPMKDPQFVEVLGESGEVEMVDWTKADTLFDVLHRPEKKRVIDKKVVSRKMTKGLIRILGEFKKNGIATRFSPHWVLVNNNLVQLRLATISEGPQDGEQGTQNVGQQEKTKGDEQDESFFGGRLSSVKSKTVEGQRWRAPEVSRMNEEQIDEVSALVFSLGMVLWEVWTEEVPWKELDEANAARQNEGGVTPNLKLVVDADIRELIIKCLSFDPKDRPSLQDVLSGLGEAESKVAQLPAHLTKPSDADIRS